MFEGSLYIVVNRDIESVESFLTEFREASYQSLDLRHHIRLGLFPFCCILELDTVHARSKLNELRTLDVEMSDVKFSPDDFGNIELTPEEMVVIFPFIEE